jgi:hypothetical protein
MNVNFLDRFFKKFQISIFIEIRPVGAELFHADRRMDWWKHWQTDMAKLMVDFRNFAKSFKKGIDTTAIHRSHMELRAFVCRTTHAN